VNERLLTVCEIAEWARVSERTVRRAIAAGHLLAGRAEGQLRIDPADARQWIFGEAASPTPLSAESITVNNDYS
jgi:excisionase family DNA binding protein